MITPHDRRFTPTRRDFLGAVAGGAVLVGLSACGSETSSPALPASGDDFSAPRERRSRNGVLDVTLVAEGRTVRFGTGRRYAYTYNGTTPGPTLRLRPGDTLRITLVNHLSETTNLHTHGLHVSPSGSADNIFVMVPPGGTHRYEYRIPDDHPSGLFWYHPHHHGSVAPQVFGGLAGAIIIDDAIDDLPAIASSRERVMVLADPAIGTSADAFGASMMERMQGREGDVALVNGVVAPTIRAVAGSIERWRLVNASASRFYRLALTGAAMHQIATDAGRLARPVAVDEVLLAPGERVELLLAPTRAGRYAFRSLPYDRGTPMMGGGGMGGGTGGSSGASDTITLATLVARDSSQAASLPTRLADLRSLTSSTVDRERDLTLAMGMGGGGMGGGGMGGGGMDGQATINGDSFDPNRTDVATRLGDVEEWTIRNASAMDHPFHLHVWPFLVIDDGNGHAPPGWKDTVNVPANSSVRIRLAFLDIPGRTVFHCHILDHEDLGMMGVIDVT
ncbi:MAG: multicopper oxidase family protein [Acidimicrobiia bacterium]|nr:multicopper oxidase family protein [Acidimicrobiia bacterium]